jgi:hypothetical protein
MYDILGISIRILKIIINLFKSLIISQRQTQSSIYASSEPIFWGQFKFNSRNLAYSNLRQNRQPAKGETDDFGEI